MTLLRALVLALALCGLADAVVTTLRLDALQARLEALPSTVCLPVPPGTAAPPWRAPERGQAA
jgi:hypothetical protein